MTAIPAKKDTQKLQRAIVDGLEDVKAQDIRVFNTEHLSPLFERVIVASGTSNRQTKALAASVRDKVREAGFPKPRIEGEDNGEWIIVDCGAAVAHVMQPSIRQYYNLEEIWGDKPVRLKLGAPKPVVATASAPEVKKPGRTAAKAPGARVAKTASSSAGDAPAAPKKPARKAADPVLASKSAKPIAKRSSDAPAKVAKTVVVKPSAKAPAKKAASRTAPAKAPARPAAAKKAPARKTAGRA
jgi:ribosome-associated protein